MKNALTTAPSPAKEKTTWGVVCQQVGFADNLYRVCREKLGNEFTPSSPFGDMGGMYDEDFEDADPNFDFDKALKETALPIPKKPPADWKPEPEGLMEQLMDGSLSKKIMIYGGGAVALWLLWDTYLNKKTASAPAGTSALSAPIASAFHIPAANVSDNAPTTVDIPASLRG